MWTYLAIFFSLALLIGVFVRRACLYSKSKSPVQGSGSAADEREEKLVEEEKKFSRKEKEELSDLVDKAELSLKAGNEEDAIKYFVQALAMDSLHQEVQHKLAMLYMNKQMFSAAAVLFKSLGDITGEAVHYSHQGLALFQQNLFEEAKVAYQKAVEKDPSRPQRFASLAQVYRSLGQFQNAIIAMHKARDLDDKNVDFLFLLAEVHAEAGNHGDAIKLIKDFLKIDPESEEAKKLLKSLEKKKLKNG